VAVELDTGETVVGGADIRGDLLGRWVRCDPRNASGHEFPVKHS
jgi:hypothetical protein